MRPYSVVLLDGPPTRADPMTSSTLSKSLVALMDSLIGIF